MLKEDKETGKEHRETIARLAKDAFKDHTVTLMSDDSKGFVRAWRCSRPGTGIYSFSVVVTPYFISVYGDVGDHILRMGSEDPVKWLRSAINSVDYVIEKMLGKKEIFMEGDAYALLDRGVEAAKEDADYYLEQDSDDPYAKEIVDKAEEFKRKVLEQWDPDYGWGEQQFAQAYYENGGDSELLHSVMDWHSSVYWTYHCLKKFIELLDEKNEVLA